MTAGEKLPLWEHMSHLQRAWPIRAGRTSWLVAAGVCIILLAGLALIDPTLSRYGQGLPAPVVTIFRWLTRLGDSDYILIPSLIVLLAGGGAALLTRKESVRSALRRLAGIGGFVFVGVGLPSLFTTIVKRMIGRSRPAHLETVGAFDFRTFSWLDWTYQSFPSGHTTTGFALCFVVSFLFPRTFPLMLVLATLVGVSRIVLGAHYATDVLAGAVVGTLGAYLVRNVFAARGWVFERRPDGAVGVKSFAPLKALVPGR